MAETAKPQSTAAESLSRSTSAYRQNSRINPPDSANSRSFETDKLVGNLRALIEALNKAKPATSKGIYLRKVALSSTMGVGVRVDAASINAAPVQA